MSTPQDSTPNTLDIKFDLIQELTRPSKRDQQRRIGPSLLGNPCARCLAYEMTEEGRQGGAPNHEFSLYPWLGTAGHAYLERTVFQSPEYLHEVRLYVGDVPGYGPISGTADLVKQHDVVIDWKFVGIKKIKAYRAAKKSPQQYRYQRQIYARGCELAGYPVQRVANVYIPRDSGNVQDIWVDEEAYQPVMAERALERAGDVYAEALLHGSESLPSDPDCWVCNNIW